jgi:hypothetical protein
MGDMRELTQDERALRARRLEKLPAFLSERMPVLADFAERLELSNPASIVIDPEGFLPSIDTWMKNQAVTQEDRVWIVTRLGYFIGELLIQRMNGGCWFLNESHDSRYFLDYVVGRFPGVKNSNAMVNPFYVADRYVTTSPPRDLIGLVAQLEEELRTA